MLSQFQAILVGGLCPGTDDPAECEANLPGFWAQIAALLWPGYWDPNVSWTIHSLASVRVFQLVFPTRRSGCVPPSVQNLRTPTWPATPARWESRWTNKHQSFMRQLFPGGNRPALGAWDSRHNCGLPRERRLLRTDRRREMSSSCGRSDQAG